MRFCWLLITDPWRRLGRQSADHPCLNQGMLWVQLPPGPLQLSSWSSLECSPPCHGGDHGFKSHRGRSAARYANRQSGQAQTLVIVCGFDSHPCYCKHALAGHWRAQAAVTRPPLAVQVQLLPDALGRPVRLSAKDTSPSSWRDGFDSHTGYWNRPSGGTGRHATLRTSCLRAWEFDSPLGHCGVDWSLVSSTVS